MSIATASDVEIAPAPVRPLAAPLVLAAGCVALGDWLFYGWEVGISLALFLAVLGIAAVAGSRARAPRKIQIAMAVIFVAGLLALIEHVNALSVAVATLATALFVIVSTARETSPWPWRLLEAVTIPFRGPFQLAGDLFRSLQSMKGHVPQWLSMNSLVAWIIPLAACFVFISLFASANPLIEYRLQQIDLRAIFDNLAPTRIGFWMVLVCAIWPLLLRRAPQMRVWQSEPRIVADHSDLDHLFGVQAVTRSLILFNVLFALQSALDLTYLWGGASLPDGMTYALLCAPRRLSPDRDRAARRRLCPDRDAPGRARRAIQADPAAGAAMDRTKRPARDLLDLPARSLCRGLLVDLSAARRLHLDGAGGGRAGADADPDQTEKAQFLADHRQRRLAGIGAVRMLLHQRAAAGGVLQCGAFAGKRRHRAKSRFAVSRVARPASAAAG